jgi:hypothetical protein
VRGFGFVVYAMLLVADCRMVDSRWNGRTQRYEAEVVRDTFSNALRNSALHENDTEAFSAALRVWIDSLDQGLRRRTRDMDRDT